MKLTFESNLVFHQEAVKSITDLFYKSIANLLFRKDLKNSKVVGITTVKNSNVPKSSCFYASRTRFENICAAPQKYFILWCGVAEIEIQSWAWIKYYLENNSYRICLRSK